MQTSNFVRIDNNILLEYIQDESNLISEEYLVYKNSYTEVNGFLSTLPETKNYINEKTIVQDGQSITKKFTNQLVKLNQVQSQWGRFSDTYSFIQSRNYGISIPIRYDRVRVWIPVNYVFEEYKGFHLRAYVLDNLGKWTDLSNYYFDISDVNQSDEIEYANPPLYQFEMNWGKYFDIQFPSPQKVSEQVRRGEIRPNTINSNLTDGVGLSKESPIFFDFYFIQSIRRVNGNPYYNLVDKKSLTFPIIPRHEKFGTVIEPSNMGNFFLIYPIYNGTIGQFNTFIEESISKGSRYYLEWTIDIWEKNIKVSSQKLLITENFIEKIEFRPIFKYTTTTAIIDVTADLIDSVNGAKITRKSSYGLLQDEVSNYSRFLSKIDLSKATKVQVYKIKGIETPNLDSNNSLSQKTEFSIDPVSYIVYDRKYDIVLDSINVEYSNRQWFGDRKLTISLFPYDNILKFNIIGINDFGEYSEVNLLSYSDISIDFINDKKNLSFSLWQDSDQNDLEIGKVVFKINEDKYGEIKRIYDSGTYLFYITGLKNNSRNIIWSGMFITWDSELNKQNLTNLFNNNLNSIIKKVKGQNFDELSKINSIKDSVNNNSNINTSTITSGEIQTDAKISASKTENPENVTKEMKNDVLNLWNPYWSGSFEVMLKSYQYVYESVDSSNLKSYTVPSSYRLFGITLKDLGLIKTFELDKITGFLTTDSKRSCDLILGYLKIFNFNPNDKLILQWISNNKEDIDNYLQSKFAKTPSELIQSSNVPPSREIYDMINNQVSRKNEISVNPKFIRSQKEVTLKSPFKTNK